MAACASCSAVLEPTWKFCVRCGAAVATPPDAGTRGSRPRAPMPVPPAEPIPGAIRPDAAAHRRAAPRLNPLAVIALVLACLAVPVALVFGHVATARIRTTGERGLLAAQIATVLGYVWLVVEGIWLATFLVARLA